MANVDDRLSTRPKYESRKVKKVHRVDYDSKSIILSKEFLSRIQFEVFENDLSFNGNINIKLYESKDPGIIGDRIDISSDGLYATILSTITYKTN